ncbi:MAG: M56 family metallopeptidase [Reichenbachiella sp.]|uniref:M56 family metallopeptidase n=1 Tax=Reichenbachiella sp. TaxID=2184521 RepID=UPI0032659670
MIEYLFLSNFWIFKSSFFLAIVFLFQWLFLRRKSAAFRHMIWVVGFVGVLSLPLLSFFVNHTASGIQIPVDGNIIFSRAIAQTSTGLTEQFKGHPGTANIAHNEAEANSNWLAKTNLKFWINAAWIFGIAVYLIRLVTESILLHFLYKRSKNGNRQLHELLDELSGIKPSKRQTKIVLSDHIDMPFTTGWSNSVIFIPTRIGQSEKQKQRLILLHELAHIERLDGLSTLLTQLACAVCWYNPLVWLAAKASKLDMEKACDDRVVRTTHHKYDYAGMMLDILEMSSLRPLRVQSRLALAHKNELKSRMTALLDDQIDRKRLGRHTLVSVTVIGLVALIGLAALRVVEEIPPKKQSTVDITQYLHQLENGTHEEQKYAAWALGTAETGLATDKLLQQLSHPNPEVRTMIVWALGELKVGKTLYPLLASAEDPVALVREMAAKSIGELENPAAIGTLKSLLVDDDIGVRTSAIWALGEIRTKESLTLVGQGLSDQALMVNKMALKVLSERKFQSSIPAIANLIDSEDEQLRVSATQALVQMRATSTYPYLIKALQDQSPTVRMQAVKGLGGIKDKKAAPVLIPLLQDPSIQVREMVVWALDELKI